MGRVTLTSDAKFLKDDGTCTSAPIFCSKRGCHETWMTVCVYVCVCVCLHEKCTGKSWWKSMLEVDIVRGGKWALTTQVSPYSNSQAVCWISPSTLGRFVIFWIFGNLLCALDVKHMYILKWSYFNLDGNKEEMMDPTVIIASAFMKPIAFKKKN